MLNHCLLNMQHSKYSTVGGADLSCIRQHVNMMQICPPTFNITLIVAVLFSTLPLSASSFKTIFKHLLVRQEPFMLHHYHQSTSHGFSPEGEVFLVNPKRGPDDTWGVAAGCETEAYHLWNIRECGQNCHSGVMVSTLAWEVF